MFKPRAPRPVRTWRPSWQCRPDHDFDRYILEVQVLLPDGRVYSSGSTIPFGLWESLKPKDRVGWLEYRVTGMLSKVPAKH